MGGATALRRLGNEGTWGGRIVIPAASRSGRVGVCLYGRSEWVIVNVTQAWSTLLTGRKILVVFYMSDL